MRELQQYALVGKGFSGRGVRVRELDGAERDDALSSAAKDVGKEASNVEWSSAAVRLCICKMIVSVTKQRGLTSTDEILKATWATVSEQQLLTPGSEWSLGKLFNAKDQDVLASIYKRAHECTAKEVEDIMGKGLAVSED